MSVLLILAVFLAVVRLRGVSFVSRWFWGFGVSPCPLFRTQTIMLYSTVTQHLPEWKDVCQVPLPSTGYRSTSHLHESIIRRRTCRRWHARHVHVYMWLTDLIVKPCWEKGTLGFSLLARVRLRSCLCQVVRARPTGNRETGWISGSLGAQSSSLFSREVVI